MRRLLAIALPLALLASGVVAWWASTQLAPLSDGAAPELLFAVESGDALGPVARRLEARGLIRNARVLELLGRVTGRAAEIQAGEYGLSASLSPREILDQIVEGRIYTYRAVLPEGFTAAQIGARLASGGFVDAADFQAAVVDPTLARELGVPADTLEGYLFPETYRMPKGLPAREVAEILVGQFMAAWKQVEPGAAARGLSMHQVVTLASVVEKETGAAVERSLIASVFSNRMERGMRLESDPTVIYGIPDFDGNLRRRDLDDPSNLYNTYRHQGLPPGPIANPGLAALLAVVAPADTEYLFFVSRNDGTHKFSKTYKEHVNAVNRFQRKVSSR